MTQPIPRAQPAVAERLAEIVGERYVLSRQSELLVYNWDRASRLSSPAESRGFSGQPRADDRGGARSG